MMDRAALYAELMASGERGDPFDRHLFARMVAAALEQTAEGEKTLEAYLGLPLPLLRLLFTAYFPIATLPDYGPQTSRTIDETIEEEDFRCLLLRFRSRGVPEEEWLAAIVAHRAQGPGHLWEDLGFMSRDDLNQLFRRHFTSLFQLNDKNMRWKKFIYRMMCEQEGLRLCKAPHCEECCDVGICFENGSPLLKNPKTPLPQMGYDRS